MVKTCSRPSLKTSDGRREKCKLKKEHHCLQINGDPEIGGENKIELDGLKFIKEEIFWNLLFVVVRRIIYNIISTQTSWWRRWWRSTNLLAGLRTVHPRGFILHILFTKSPLSLIFLFNSDVWTEVPLFLVLLWVSSSETKQVLINLLHQIQFFLFCFDGI